MLIITDPNCSHGYFSMDGDIKFNGRQFSLAIGDFNNDGKQDLAFSNIDNNSASVRLVNGVGYFIGSTEVGVINGGPRYLAIGDFNGDGKQDLVTISDGDYWDNGIWLSSASIRLGNGLGGFSGILFEWVQMKRQTTSGLEKRQIGVQQITGA